MCDCAQDGVRSCKKLDRGRLGRASSLRTSGNLVLMTKTPSATGVSSASGQCWYPIINGTNVNEGALSHVQSSSPVQSASDSISERHCWVRVDVVTGARGGDCCWVENADPEKFLVACAGKSSDELRSQGSGFDATRKEEGRFEPKPPAPKRKLQLPNSIQAGALHPHARFLILQATGNWHLHFSPSQISLQDAHMDFPGPRPPEPQTKCTLAMLRSVCASIKAESNAGSNLNSATLRQTAVHV